MASIQPSQSSRADYARQRPVASSDPQPHVHPIRHAAFAVGELIMLVVALVLAAIVHGHPGPLPGDVGGSLDVQHLLLPHHLLTQSIDAVSTINWPIPSAIGLAVMAIILLALRWRMAAVGVLVVAALADGTSYLINDIVRRPRPHGYGVSVLQHITNYFSFPSGHVVHALAVFGFVIFLTYQVRRGAVWLWIVRVILVALILLMGPSRILEGEHWPSDVLEGVLIGALWLIASIHIYLWARRRWPRLQGRGEDEAQLSRGA